MNILCVDIGTSSIKGGVIDSSAGLVRWGRQALIDDSTETFDDWSPLRWTEALQSLFPSLANGLSIDAVAVSGNGPTLVALDATGRAFGPVLHWIAGNDDRLPDLPSFFLPKVRWFEKHRPDEFARARRYLSCPDYINLELTGNQLSVIPSDEFAPYVWTDDGLAGYGFDRRLFPEHVHTGTRIGNVTAEASVKYGLPRGVPVFGAGADFLMALLGTATVRPGRTCDRAGTSEGINYCANRPVFCTRLRTLPHVIPGLYNVAGILSSTGRIFEWFRRIVGFDEESYSDMLSEIAAVGHRQSRPHFLPSLHEGPTWEFSGAAFMHVEPEHGAAEMGRAVVEAIGFSVRDLVDTIEDNGCEIDTLRVSGGQARSAVWSQMKADITGKAVWVPAIVDAELVGCAAVAVTGLGHFGTVSEAAEELVIFRERYEPRMQEHRRFSESYSQFTEICRRVVGILSDYVPLSEETE